MRSCKIQFEFVFFGRRLFWSGALLAALPLFLSQSTQLFLSTVSHSIMTRNEPNAMHQTSPHPHNTTLSEPPPTSDFTFIRDDSMLLPDGGTLRFTVLSRAPDDAAAASPLAHGDALRLLRDDAAFREQLLQVLRDGLGDGVPYFFETPPISRATMSARPFEFVLVAAPALSRSPADPRCKLV